VPIVAGARLSGKAGAWNIGALNIESDDLAPTGTLPGALQTNFNVLRVRRDIFRRSTIGGMFTNRSLSASGSGSNQAWGLDTSLAFSQNMYLSAFVAQTKTTGRSGRDYSYRTQFSYAADRYGLMVDRIEAQPNFNPELGFMRRMDFREHIVSGRFSPRPAKNKRVRKYFYEGGLTDVAAIGLARNRELLQREQDHRGLSRPCQSHAAARRRAEHLAELDRSAAEDIHEYGHRNADPLFDDAADVHHGARPVRLEHAQPVRERALPLGIHARQRALRRLHRRARHIDPQRDRAAESRPRGEDQ
jgi:hypothetical protein